MKTFKPIIEYTILIAVFMGYIWSEEGDGKTYLKEFRSQKNIYSVRPENLRYHSSWDLLIPAIEKYNKKYGINLLYSKNCFNVYNLYKSLGSQLTLRKNETLEATITN